MKFDKFMEHCYKVLCLVTALVVAFGTVVSCTRPLRACAVEISAEEQAGIYDFFDEYANNLNAIDFEFNSDASGDRNIKLQVYSLQNAAFQGMFQIYDNMDFSVAPDSISISGSGCSGFYKKSDTGDTLFPVLMHYPGPLTPSGSVLFSSQDFQIGYKANARSYDIVYSVYPSSAACGYTNVSYISGNPSTFDNLGFFVGTTMQAPYTHFTKGFSSSIPTLTRGRWIEDIPYLGGFVGSYSLPSETVPTVTPWEYYNDYILPDIVNNYDIDNIEQFLVFPDGYSPDVQPTDPNYNNTNNVYIIPIIIGDPLPVDITDEIGNILDVLDILADLLPDGGLQIQIDGITLSFPRDGDSVVIDGTKYPLPLPDFSIDGHTINLPDNVHFDFDGIPFTINSNGTITINGDTFNLPIGTPKQLSTEYDNYVYEYEIPTIEKINVVDADLSAPDLTRYNEPIQFIYSMSHDVLEDSGVLPVFLICLALSAVGYGLWKIGG